MVNSIYIIEIIILYLLFTEMYRRIIDVRVSYNIYDYILLFILPYLVLYSIVDIKKLR